MEQDCWRRGTVKPVWNVASKTAKPLTFFSTKPGTTITGIMERYPQIFAVGMKGGLRVIDDGLLAVR